jgi:hypothetical protein
MVRVASGGDHVQRVALDPLAILRLHDPERSGLAQNLAQVTPVIRLQVHHQHEPETGFRGRGRQELPHRLDPARGCADADDD